MRRNFKHYIKELLNIAWPIVMGNIGFILIGAGDVLVAGRHSTDTLSAISIAVAVLNCILIFGTGLLSSVTPILSNIRGAGGSATKYFYPTVRFSLVTSVVLMASVFACIPLIDVLGFEPHLVAPIKQYMFITALCSPFIYLQIGLKEFLQAHEIVFFPNLVILLCVVLNIVLNVIFVFGWGPVPELGTVGLAVASYIVRVVMMLALLIYCYKIMKFESFADREYYKSIFKVGLPISFAIMIEFVAFNSMAIIMGRQAGIYAAAHNLICTLTTIPFMVALAISNAIAVKVGFANGADNMADLKRYAFNGTAMAVGFMACSALVFVSFPEFLVKLFTSDAALIKIALPIMYLVGAFQVFDGLQVSLSGIFKGIKKTKIVLISNLIGYWGLAIPLGYYLAIVLKMELIGFWWGLFAAGVFLCTLMLGFLLRHFKKMKLTLKPQS